MEIEVRPVRKLRESAGAQAAFGPLIGALAESDADLSRLRVVCDWIQYRNNFRDIAMIRPILAAGDAAAEEHELAIDLRRCAQPDADVAATVTSALAGIEAPDSSVVWLEDWTPGSASCAWRFNALYWQHLADWEEATGKEYERALPGGESDARNSAAARDLFKMWDELANRRALPDELYVLELDYSSHVLDRARETVAHHGDHVSGLVLEATRLSGSVGFLAGKAFCVYISNVYDNLPADEVASIRGRVYLVQVRSFLHGADADAIVARFGISRADIAPLTARLLRIGPELLAESMPGCFGDRSQAASFWQRVWGGLRQAERYVPLVGLDTYQVTPSVTGEILRSALTAAGDVRMHVSNGALSSFADTLPLLHPFGRLVCHDLFTTSHEEYRTGFYGPGKYDGSVVNWVNGPLLQLLASRRGFDVRFTPFKQRPGATIKTLTAQVRD
jgi:hypothetical protein